LSLLRVALTFELFPEAARLLFLRQMGKVTAGVEREGALIDRVDDLGQPVAVDLGHPMSLLAIGETR
jgi:hypothetical protein